MNVFVDLTSLECKVLHCDKAIQIYNDWVWKDFASEKQKKSKSHFNFFSQKILRKNSQQNLTVHVQDVFHANFFTLAVFFHWRLGLM